MQSTLILMLGGACGAVITFLLQKYGISSVVASSLVGLSGALFASLISNTYLDEAIFIGSFVGMTTLSLGTLPMMLIAGLGAGFLYSITLNILPDLGGRLGTIAFASILFVIWVKDIFKPKSIIAS